MLFLYQAKSIHLGKSIRMPVLVYIKSWGTPQVTSGAVLQETTDENTKIDQEINELI